MTEALQIELPRLSGTDPWAALAQALETVGGAIVAGFLPNNDLESLNQQVNEYLAGHEDTGLPVTGSANYDRFLGQRTIRLHGLLEKLPLSQGLIGHKRLLSCAQNALYPCADSLLLSAAELIQINPGEPAQLLHRDTDSWPVTRGKHPVIVNAITALDDFTSDNGATAVAPGSWAWPDERNANPDELTQAIMHKGDALVFRGDLIHGGGENRSRMPRRALSVSYCAGWLRPVENSFLNLSLQTILAQPPHIQALLGFSAHDGTRLGAGMIGLYENGDPMNFLEEQARSNR